MRGCERQILADEKFYDEKTRAAEKEDIGSLAPAVPGSRPHEVIDNPVDSGSNEG